MKANIHPKYQEAVVTCACGATWTTRSTRTQLRTDVCSSCHPFFTGEQRIIDTAGQVERFMNRMKRARERPAPAAKAAAAPVAAPKPPKAPRPAARPATLETMLDTPASSEA